MSTPTNLAIYRWKRQGPQRRENRWPGGIRLLGCLRCAVRFASRQRDERLCGHCRAANAKGEWEE